MIETEPFQCDWLSEDEIKDIATKDGKLDLLIYHALTESMQRRHSLKGRTLQSIIEDYV